MTDRPVASLPRPLIVGLALSGAAVWYALARLAGVL